MMVFVANCVATVLVIYSSVALATWACVHLACPCIVVLYKSEWVVHRDVEYQVEGSFVVLMWALLLRCATRHVTGFLG